ncbi:MAG TPA: XRE family transcriptional regulator [Polyangia bacterium]|jgi:DNA-binding XRE family transcriptional regulator|nr:XRE family transcriptional regulator [Polyangia bacterium]
MKRKMAQSEAGAQASDAAAKRRSAVLTKATIRVADQLGLGQAALAKVLGISPATVSRMFKGDWTIPVKDAKTWELAAMLVRIFRSLGPLVGGNEKHVKEWFHAENIHLAGVPANLVFKIEGLTNVARYLDAVRGAQ